MSVREYEQRYNSLIRYAPYMLANDELKANKHFQGLKPVLRRYMATMDIRSYHQVVQKVLALEREFEDSRASSKKVEARPANLGKSAGKRPMVENQGPSKR